MHLLDSTLAGRTSGDLSDLAGLLSDAGFHAAAREVRARQDLLTQPATAADLIAALDQVVRGLADPGAELVDGAVEQLRELLPRLRLVHAAASVPVSAADDREFAARREIRTALTGAAS